MGSDDVTALLAGIKERAAHADRVLKFGGSFRVTARSQADVPRLVAAVEAVLALTDKPSTGIPPIVIREAITRELSRAQLSEEAGDGA